MKYYMSGPFSHYAANHYNVIEFRVIYINNKEGTYESVR